MAASGGFFRSLVSDIKARFRGEKRIAPRGTRGRVYQKPQDVPASGRGSSALGVKPQPEATLTITVTRADGTVESQTVPAQVTEVRDNG